jgi:hypothetical protein
MSWLMAGAGAFGALFTGAEGTMLSGGLVILDIWCDSFGCGLGSDE